MKVLIGCEESQAVCKAFRELGHEAYSCDLLPCSGGHPEWHLQMDIFKVIDGGVFITQDLNTIVIDKWDLGIFHPECTRLTVTANKWYKPEYADRFPNIHKEREEAVRFFMRIANCKIEQTAIENPIGIMSTRYRKPNQVIQPYQFGSPVRKSTCLWLKGLPNLTPTDIVEHKVFTFKSGKTMSMDHYLSASLPKEERRKKRSVTYPGIAKAMAEQWSEYLKTH